MLRLRICPNCHEEIRSPEAYFCHRCGAELPSPPGVGEDSQSPVETPLPRRQAGRRGVSTMPKPKNRKLRIAAAAALCAALLLVAVAAGVYYFQIRPFRSSPSPATPSPKSESFVADISFAVENHPFSAKGLSEIVPADVDLYLESVDPEILLPSLMSEEDWSEVESFCSEDLGLSVGEAASFLEDEYAVIQESTASAFLARVRDGGFVEQKIAEVGSHEDWQAKLVNGFLVIANSPDLIHKIEEAQKKLTLNLSLTSGFAEGRQKLPKTGQIFYYGKKKLEFIPNEVKGEAFVISKKDGGTLVVGL